MSNWLTRHSVISTLAVIWAMALVTYVTVQVFGDVTRINTAVNAALVTVYGLPAVAFGIYKWRIVRDAKRAAQSRGHIPVLTDEL